MENIVVEFLGFTVKRAIEVNSTGSRWVDCPSHERSFGCSRRHRTIALEYCKTCPNLALIGLDLEDNKPYVWCKR